MQDEDVLTVHEVKLILSDQKKTQINQKTAQCQLISTQNHGGENTQSGDEDDPESVPTTGKILNLSRCCVFPCLTVHNNCLLVGWLREAAKKSNFFIGHIYFGFRASKKLRLPSSPPLTSPPPLSFAASLTA